MGKRISTHRVLVGNVREETLGRPRHRWEDNIKMDLQEVGCGGVDWIDVTLYTDRWWVLVTTVLNPS
jgi:hypothetical protein